ncbi:peroxisomal membrane protein 4 [Protomyces lactucae-debilis]|uniref:Peroxisomal membrane protein 4 n=1 Tax=Protomyces lactucae-debilis TaxID=2754530 RepID=A0A1Y2FD77_PROLT|nr:peroxisomal membrane protein 4 [Protomyces lactucae-debilis]ORY81882.1 peroxisomal membrane protein 4 [Protomyces lactucae-debilis]
MDTLNKVLLDPKYHDLLAIVKGMRNGAVYGAKIRAPHAAVMTFLFKTGTFRERLVAIFKATKQHSQNLAVYVTIYKTTMYVLRQLNGKERSMDSFLAGLLGGYVVFGENNNINQQMVLYVFSRILLGAANSFANSPSSRHPNRPRLASHEVREKAWPVFASVCWASVMWLWRHYPDELQPSLRNSMNYLYLQSDSWTEPRNFFWHNQ